MVGMIVGENDQREPIARLPLHVLHAVVHGAYVRRMNTAIDQDVRGTVLSRHRQQEEIAETDTVHAHADVGVPTAAAAGCAPAGAGVRAAFGSRPFRWGFPADLRPARALSGAAFGEAFLADLRPAEADLAGARVFRETLGAAFRLVFLAALVLATSSTPRATGRSWPGSGWDRRCHPSRAPARS